MKTNHRLIVKLTALGLLVILSLVFTQCISTNTDQVGHAKPKQNSYSSGPLSNIEKDEAQIINEAQVSEGMKSHEQILFTMSTLTGVAVNGNVKTVYDQVATTLPTDNDIKVFLPPHQLAITKLAAEFCNTLVENTTLRANVWKLYKGFGSAPNTGLDFNNRDLIIEEVIDAFWGEVITQNERDTAVNELHSLIEDMLTGEPATAATTRNVIKGVCTSVLSSAHVTLL